MAQQGGLGRGLASLIPQKKQIQVTDPVPEGEVSEVQENESRANQKTESESDAKTEPEKRSIALKSIMEVTLDVIDPNPHQPRDDFNEEGLQELANSIKEHGVLQPLVVTSKDDGRYELIAGERRLEASKIAGLEKVPIIVKDVDEQSKAELALVENIQRHNLNPLEEAKAYKKLRDTFALTQEEIAFQVGKSRSSISNSLRLLNLPMEIQQALVSGLITEGHARTILAVSNAEKQRALFEMITKENLTVRQAEDVVREATKGQRHSKKRHIDPDSQEKEERLAEILGTKVRIKRSKTGGQIIIDFYSAEEFEALISKLTEK